MTKDALLEVRPEVAEALAAGKPVVALETTLIAHGLPWPLNMDTARAAEEAVRGEGGVPATIGILCGRAIIGLREDEIHLLARGQDVVKASRRDLGVAIAQGRTAATTVAATMALAHGAGIRIMATGGIGGAHRDLPHSWDVSADLMELARTAVAVVCAGAKSILDIPRTLEILETYGVPVLGYGCDEFPAFFVRSSGERVMARVDGPQEAAEVLRAHWALGSCGAVLAQPVTETMALHPDALENALSLADQQALGFGVRGKELTPFLLSRLAEITEGQTLQANHALVIANARLAAQVARALVERD